MCKCTPNIRTPFCGKPGCKPPPQNVDSAMRHIDRMRTALTADYERAMRKLDEDERDLLGLKPDRGHGQGAR